MLSESLPLPFPICKDRLTVSAPLTILLGKGSSAIAP
jgi:hypothetical protein